MVNFYSYFVACSKDATLSQVAGKWTGPHSDQVGEEPRLGPTPATPYRPPGLHQEGGRR